ncbi:MAG: N-6 DNA methylase, partial [Rubrimonas sp.]
MSTSFVDDYFRELDALRRAGALTEPTVSQAFGQMLKAWGKSRNLIFLQQHAVPGRHGRPVVPDGALVHDIRVRFGLWEAKHDGKDIDVEIAAKRKKGYPLENIVFENTRTAVLYQNDVEALRADMADRAALEKLLALFFAWERPEIADWRRAVETFRHDLPAVLDALRARIADAYEANPAFRAKAAAFLDHCRDAINPTVTEADVREMLIQHVLTEDIFNAVFDNTQFHRENNVAQKLYDLEAAFFTGAVKHEAMAALRPYYAAIRANAAQIADHAEKQTFLKLIYENFYKVYDPKKADRLGVVYTPGEIVRFMVEGADWLCREHFGRRLIDPGVNILDPACGTGTFVVELLNHFRGQPKEAIYR